MLKLTTTLAILGALLLAPSVAGARGPGGGNTSGTTTISLARPADADVSWPHYNDLVEFSVATTATTEPFVNLQCFQSSALVAEGWAGYFDGALGSRQFGLASPQWTGGAADCTAYVAKYTRKGWQRLGSTSFHVSA